MDKTDSSSHDTLSLRSLAVHAGREDLTELGVHAVPIDLSTTAPLPSIAQGRDAYDLLASGQPLPDHMTTVYRRAWNPTVARFERSIAALEAHGTDISAEGIAFASGMAATTAVFLSRVAAGLPHVIAVRPLYGGTDGLLASGLLGTKVTYVDATDIADAITAETGLIVIESPSNPTLDLIDIAAVVTVAGDIPVMVDNTFATPILQQPLALGATFSVHSATKYLGGHGDTMGGVVVTDPIHAATIRPIRTITGGVLDPWTAYLLHRGLATLPIRVRAQQETALAVALWLSEQPGVTRVFYPGLSGCDPQGLVGRQMNGPGAMLSFELDGGFGAAEEFVEKMTLITHAVSLGGIDTLIEHPAALTHRIVEESAQPAAGILRLSIGLESAEDLTSDLAQGLVS